MVFTFTITNPPNVGKYTSPMDPMVMLIKISSTQNFQAIFLGVRKALSLDLPRLTRLPGVQPGRGLSRLPRYLGFACFVAEKKP